MKIGKESALYKAINGDASGLNVASKYLYLFHTIESFLKDFTKEDYKMYYLSKPFQESLIPACMPLLKARRLKGIANGTKVSSILIIPRPDQSVAVIFSTLDTNEKGRTRGKVMSMKSNGHVNQLVSFDERIEVGENIASDPHYEVMGFCEGYDSTTDTVDAETYLQSPWKNSMAAILYMKYGEIETIHLKKGKTMISKCDKPFMNEEGISVTCIKSTWLRNLVMGEAFKVSGHFRLQPHGEGRKDRKLIWINEHKKKGYSRAADRWREMPTKN